MLRKMNHSMGMFGVMKKQTRQQAAYQNQIGRAINQFSRSATSGSTRVARRAGM